LDQKRRFQVQHRRFWRKNNDSRSDFAVFSGKTAFLDPTSAFLPENQRFQIQLSRFWTKNGDSKSDFGVFAGRTAISSPTFPFLDARTEILNPIFWWDHPDDKLVGRVTPCAPVAVPLPIPAGRGLPALPFVPCWENYFFRLNRSYSPEGNFPWHTN